MMYNNKLVTCIKVNSKILREFKDAVYVPFGSEYSILVKNLNSVRAIVNLQIDGTEVCPGGLIVGPNSEIDIERFVKDLDKGNKFKFIERTQKIEDGPRGIKSDDGLIRVSFKWEKVVQTVTTVTDHVYHNTVHHYPYHWPYHRDCWGGPYYGALGGGLTNSSVYTSNVSGKMEATNEVPTASCETGGGGTMSAQGMSFNNVATASTGTLRGMSLGGSDVKSFSDVGITVPGSISNQTFKMVSAFPTETEEHVMVLRLLGEDPRGIEIVAPVTVKAKSKCQTCHRTNKATAQFCSHCGTALVVY